MATIDLPDTRIGQCSHFGHTEMLRQGGVDVLDRVAAHRALFFVARSLTAAHRAPISARASFA
jgi:hypothetical protein